jgi:hypothetical protein
MRQNISSNRKVSHFNRAVHPYSHLEAIKEMVLNGSNFSKVLIDTNFIWNNKTKDIEREKLQASAINAWTAREMIISNDTLPFGYKCN